MALRGTPAEGGCPITRKASSRGVPQKEGMWPPGEGHRRDTKPLERRTNPGERREQKNRRKTGKTGGKGGENGAQDSPKVRVKEVA